MAYATGSISDANSSLALYNALTPLLTTAGYTLVDTVVISTRTHKVWKSAAANNSMNLDWYLDVAYTTTGVGPVHLTPFEYFDPATDLGYRGAFSTNDSTIETTYYSRYGATGYALETNWFGAATGAGILTSSTAFSYWISVTPERVVGLSSLQPTLIRYTGFYQPDSRYVTNAGDKLYPLIKAEFSAPNESGTGSSMSGLTRAPKATSLPAFWPRIAGVGPEVPAIQRISPPLPGSNAWGQGPLGCPLVVGFPQADDYGRNLFGRLIGVVSVPLATTVVRGDTFTMGGVTYVTPSWVSGYPSFSCFATE